MLAIGHANGKVTFCTFGLANINNTLAGLELGPSKIYLYVPIYIINIFVITK